jgi:sugar lactone lactonase YvrE
VLIFERAAASDARPPHPPIADHVLGQLGSFRTGEPDTSDRRLAFPSGIALGPGGEFYVADTWNNRVLELDRPLASDVADRVFGQPDFTAGFFAVAPPTATSLQLPTAVAVDEAGDLFVPDTWHHRVVVYDQP